MEIAQLGAPASFDIECPLMSLPTVFRTTVEAVPWQGAYLGADPESGFRKEKAVPGAARAALGQPPGYKADRQRSTRLDTFLPLLRVPGVTWLSLQKGAAAEQLAALPDDVFVWDGSSRDRDLAETAALVSTLDLVIATDSCIAHLTGAIGKPVWILLPHLADWRWMQKIETTPWYPTARLFRQSRPGDWAGLVQRAIGELASFPRPAVEISRLHSAMKRAPAA